MSSSHPYHHGDLRNALLRQAAIVLEQSGAEAVSLRGLARALGVSHAAPAHHFAGREALMAELAAEGFAGLADTLEEALRSAPSERRLVESGRAYVRFALANPERYRLMFASRITDATGDHRLSTEGQRAFRALLRTTYGRAPDPAAAGRYRLAAPELRTWALVHGAVMLRLDGRVPDDVADEEFITLVDEALGARPPPATE